MVNFCGVSFFESMVEPYAMAATCMNGKDIRNIFVILGSVWFVGMSFAGYVSEQNHKIF